MISSKEVPGPISRESVNLYTIVQENIIYMKENTRFLYRPEPSIRGLIGLYIELVYTSNMHRMRKNYKFVKNT